MRVLLSSVLLASACGVAADEGGKADGKVTPADQLKTLRREWGEALGSLRKEVQAAGTDEERHAARAKGAAVMATFAEKALRLAASDPKDAAALDAALFAMDLSRASPGRAVDFIATHFADHPNLRPVLPRFDFHGGGEQLLRAVHEKSTTRGAKGAALYYLAARLLADADAHSSLPAAQRRAAAFAEAEALLAKAAKEYGDVEVTGRAGRQAVAKAVEGDLYVLNNLTVGKVLPDSACEDLRGKKVKVSDYRGKVVVLDVWTTACGGCVAMIPHERELVKRLAGKPFVLVSLSADDEKDTLVKFLEKEPMPWVHWWNGGPKGGPVAAYRVEGYPAIYVLDDKGVIRFKHVRGKEMDEAVDALLHEASLRHPR